MKRNARLAPGRVLRARLLLLALAVAAGGAIAGADALNGDPLDPVRNVALPVVGEVKLETLHAKSLGASGVFASRDQLAYG